jgi:hypothetical protein
MSKRPIIFSLCALALLSPFLSGCEDMKRALGMEKVVPDEFAVVQGAPLAMPPDFSLRPPKPGAAPSQEVSPTEQARQTIFRAGDQQAAAVPDADQLSTGENALLRQAGAASAPRDIRETITREAIQTPPEAQPSFVDKLLFWRTPDKNESATAQVLDPAAEAQRLKSAGATVTGPAAQPDLLSPPTIERRRDPSTTS